MKTNLTIAEQIKSLAESLEKDRAEAAYWTEAAASSAKLAASRARRAAAAELAGDTAEAAELRERAEDALELEADYTARAAEAQESVDEMDVLMAELVAQLPAEVPAAAKYEISTIDQLKAAFFDAIEKDVVMSCSCIMSFDAFDRAIGHYLDMSYDAGALDPAVADALEDGTMCEWLKELRVQYLGHAV